MTEIDPLQLVAMFGTNPKMWERIESVRDQTKLRNWPAYEGLSKDEPLWPTYVYVPVELVELILIDLKNAELSREDKLQALILAGASAWRVTQSIYRFDPELEPELIQGADFSESTEVLFRLPASAVLISVEGRHPAFVYYDFDIKERIPRLCITIMPESVDGTFSHRVPIAGHRMSDMLNQAGISSADVKLYARLLPSIIHLCKLNLDHRQARSMPARFLVTHTGATPWPSS